VEIAKTVGISFLVLIERGEIVTEESLRRGGIIWIRGHD